LKDVRFAVWQYAETAERKLRTLDSAASFECAAIASGKSVGSLANRAGRHNTRINDQRRVCFVWTDDGPASVEIVDYH
jgi:proteic killer suppression protein